MSAQQFTSTFTSGYRLKGEAIRRFETGYIVLWATNFPDSFVVGSSQFTFKGIYDYSTNSDKHRQSKSQTVTADSSDELYSGKKLRVRGHGRVLQFKITSEPRRPFDIIGWSTRDDVTKVP